MTLQTHKKKRKFIIGIAGPSGSGKTLIGKKLAKKLKAKLIHLDDYWKYKKVTRIPPMKEWKKGIWEKPFATNFNKILEDINRLKKNIIVEGLHTFNNKKLREMLDFKIYVDIPDPLITKRRLKKFGKKDNQEWYSKNIVTKFYKKYGRPKKIYADLVLKGGQNINNNIKKILNYINKIR